MRSTGGADFAAFLVRHDLGQWADRIVGTRRSSLRLETLRRGRRVATIGGTPHLAADVPWPDAEGEPLSFVADVDLAAATALLGESTLPPSGRLEFFYDPEQTAWGSDPADRPKWRVIWVDDRAIRRDSPPGIPEYARFTPLDLEGRVEPTFAEWESWRLAEGGMDRETYARYTDAVVAWKNATQPQMAAVHRLLGHPDELQAEMMLLCELASNGVSLRTIRERSEVDARFEEGARDWRLLLQIDSDQNAGMMWGDVGRIYYCIRERDLRARNWDRVWMVLQCT